MDIAVNISSIWISHGCFSKSEARIWFFIEVFCGTNKMFRKNIYRLRQTDLTEPDQLHFVLLKVREKQWNHLIFLSFLEWQVLLQQQIVCSLFNVLFSALCSNDAKLKENCWY